MTFRLVWMAQRAWSIAALSCVFLGMAGLTSHRAVVLNVSASFTVRPVPLAELIGVLFACALPVLAAPQLWTWEDLARPLKLRALRGGVALGLILVPTLVTLWTVWVGQGAVSAASSAINVSLIAALCGFATPISGARAASILGLVAYLLPRASAGVDQTPFGLALSGLEHSDRRAAIAAVLAIMSITMWIATLGRTRWLHNATVTQD
jgi:hypothetical protein